ncbi:hypothetical protein [Haloparvum sedimenti]|uniref:hypothetical protein n=1 Tax=Haloparvum sedimenti TaxID=1678448 RepID=UPI00071E78A3|nr:hypothetical protein [Haloparvum sedimenti]
MHVVGDLLARDRRSDAPALVTPDGRERSYHELITNAYKAGNVLRYLGLGAGRTLAVAPVPALPPVLAFLGAAQLGAATRFDPAAGADAGDRVLLVPATEEAAYDPAPGTQLAVFGGDPTAPETTNWEESVWSENPAFPPSDLKPETPLLLPAGAAEGTDTGEIDAISHGAALAAAAEVSERYGLDADSRVVLRAPLSNPAAVAAGLLAPLSVGGTAVLTDPAETGAEAPVRGEVAVTAGEAPEPAVLDPADVPL